MTTIIVCYIIGCLAGLSLFLLWRSWVTDEYLANRKYRTPAVMGAAGDSPAQVDPSPDPCAGSPKDFQPEN